MELMELRSKTRSRLQALKVLLSDRYDKRVINDKDCFLLPNGVLISLGGFPDFGAIVVEYAENFEEAKLNRFEDGDLFYLEEMDEETMFRAMLREIEQ